MLVTVTIQFSPLGFFLRFNFPHLFIYFMSDIMEFGFFLGFNFPRLLIYFMPDIMDFENSELKELW